MRQWYVYMLASKINGTLYVGITNNLARRLDEHRQTSSSSFTSRYHVDLLVYYEVFDSPDEAIWREKNLKSWNRLWKLQLINKVNPEWKDYSKELLE